MRTHMHDLRRVINEGHSAPCKVKVTFDLGNGDVNRKLTSRRALMCRGTWRLCAYWQFWSGFLTLVLISQSTRIYRCAVCEGNPSGKGWRSFWWRWMRETKKITCTCFMFAPKPLKYLNLKLFLHARFVDTVILEEWLQTSSSLEHLWVLRGLNSNSEFEGENPAWTRIPGKKDLLSFLFFSLSYDLVSSSMVADKSFIPAQALYTISLLHIDGKEKKMSPQFFHCQEVAPININHTRMAWLCDRCSYLCLLSK